MSHPSQLTHDSHPPHHSDAAAQRDRAGEHQGAAMKNRHLSANGAATFQPGATPQERRAATDRGLKARANRRAVGSSFQPLGICGLVTQGEYAFSAPTRIATGARDLLRSPLDRRRVVADEPSFPLTLTLSLGERGQPPPGACFAHTGLADSLTGMAQRRRTILHLPRGEGWGEGKENVAHPTVSSVSRRNVSIAQTRSQNPNASFADRHPCGLKSALRRSVARATTTVNRCEGVALGWNESGALPLGNVTIAALAAESVDVLGNIRGLL